MALSDEEKMEILSDVLPEMERFRMKVATYKASLDTQDTADYIKVRAWKAVQRASFDLRESLAHVTRVSRTSSRDSIEM